LQPPPPLLSIPPEPAPLGRLPSDARPTRYALTLRIDPSRPRFEGVADIAVELDRLRDVIWLHGRDLAVRRATIQPEGWPALEARWEQVSPSGVAALRPSAPVGPGRVTVHVEYDAPFGGNDEGLYAVERGGDHYAFSQFESTDARRAFPCFDEPAFKAPFDVVLSVPHGLAALSNTHEVSRAPEPSSPGWDHVAFAPTERLPSYLVFFGVGPLDVVPAPDVPPSAVRRRPLPLRGVATRGRGRELAYALSHTGAIVTALESYFGSEYPYDKLDLLAVPDKSGGMENAGAITFGEGILLIDEKTAPVEARSTFVAVTGHEIAHQWFGDLVTMPWWNDVWLNEAFATWMEPRLVAAIEPDLHPEIEALDSAHRAMAADSLVSARKIRQEIADDNDIESAFDAITYDKGGAVLSMFERWLGPETFQRGIHGYLGAHRFGTAVADDLLAALSAAAGRDVSGPFRTFLDQPGLPLVEATLVCGPAPRLQLKQSRFLPAGSSGSSDGSLWQIPVCARYPDGKEIREACTVLTGREGALPLTSGAGSCPAWVMPNADAAGYYRWSLAPADARKLAAALPALRERERISFAGNVMASFVRASSPTADVMDALAPLAADGSYAVAGTPMELLNTLGRWLEGDPLHAQVEAYAGALYAPAYRALGWEPKKGQAEPSGRVILRRIVLDFLAFTARDKAVRREAAARGRAYLEGHPEAVSPELANVALQVAAEEGGAPFFDALVAALASETREVQRRRLLAAIGSVADPALAARARALELDPRVRVNEVTRILAVQLRRAQTRDAAWAFLTGNLDKLLARIPVFSASDVVWHATSYCDRAHRDELEKLFAPRIAAIEGGPRSLAGALEEMNLCVARRTAQEPSAREFFARKKR
jgi:alanyl aminopeptidase